MRDGWGPAQWSSHTPTWDYWRDGWGTVPRGDTYNPRHWLLQNPGHRYNQSPWQPKRTALAQMTQPINYVIPVKTRVPQPNPFTDKGYYPHQRTIEETGRESFDLGWGGWDSLGTRGS